MLEEDKQEFQKENQKLLKFILDKRFFEQWKNNTELGNATSLELFITSHCNQKCEYCYLQKHPDLYPEECNNEETIINNLTILLNYIISNNYYLPKIDLFSGEIWYTNFGLKIFDTLLEAYKNGLECPILSIPSNFSFILNPIQTQKIQQYIDKFSAIGVNVSFSASVDGAIIESEERPLQNGIIKTEEFYERLFAFCYRNQYLYHPMVSAHSISKWIENFDWWKEQCEKIGGDVIDDVMLLEVRNDEWTDESIKEYLKFLNYIIDYTISKYGMEDLANGMIGGNTKHYINGYSPYNLIPSESTSGCTIATSLVVRLGDLAICPCHRTAYNKYLYGKFIVENNQIIDIEENNWYMADRILMANNNFCSQECSNCMYNKYCIKGCFGSQLESLGDPFFPIESVCKFEKAKIDFLIKKYTEIGLFDYLKTIPLSSPCFSTANELLEWVDEYVQKKEEEKL